MSKILIFQALLLAALFSWGQNNCLHSLVAEQDKVTYKFSHTTLKTYSENSIQGIIDRADKNLEKNSIPKMFSISEDIERSKHYKDDVLPQSLQAFLPSHTSTISRPLNFSEEKSILKMSKPSNVVVLKSKLNFKGTKTSTNIYLSKNAIMGNPSTDEKYLVGENMDAVVFWVHGGGTPTATGASAQDLIDYFDDHKMKIAVYAIDMPLHGEGSLYPFSNFIEVSEYINAHLKQNIHPSVKRFMAGHSMGGEYATMLQRVSELPQFKNMFEKIFALSFVADPSLGGDYFAKEKAEDLAGKNRDSRQDDISEKDWEFLSNIVKNGKAVPKPMYHVRMLSRFNVWDKPKYEGTHLTPMDAIIGKFDGLTMVGYEDSIDKYFSYFDPSHTQLFIRDYADTPEGPQQKLGHAIFKDPFTFKRIESEIQRIVGDNIVESVDDNRGAEQQYLENMTKVFRLWNHNFAFREYAKTIVISQVKDNEAMDNVKKSLGQLSAYNKKYSVIIKQGKKEKWDESRLQEELNQLTIPLGLSSYEETQAKTQEFYQALKQQAIPANHPQAKKLKKLVDQRLALTSQLTDAKQKSDNLYTRYSKQMKEYIRVNHSLKKFYRYITNNEIAAAEQASEDALNAAYTQYEVAEKAQQDHFNNLVKNNNWTAETLYNSPDSLIKEELKFKKLLEKYNQSIDNLVRIQRRAIVTGNFYFANSEDLQEAKPHLLKSIPQDKKQEMKEVLAAWQKPDAKVPQAVLDHIFNFNTHLNTVPRKGSFLSQMIESHKQLNEYSAQRIDLQNQINDLLLQYSQITPEYGEVEALTLHEALQMDYDQAFNWMKEIGRAVTMFEEFWSYRVPVESLDADTI